MSINNKLKKVSSFFNKNGISEDASLINYFIKKFANENPNDLLNIYDNIPKEEQQDFINAVNEESERIDDSYDDINDYHLNEIYDQMRKMDREKIMFKSKDGNSITMGDLLDTLGSESKEAL